VLTVAYLANLFPSEVEPYVAQEIKELRQRGVRVITGSVRKRERKQETPAPWSAAEIVLQPVRAVVLLQAVWLGLRRWNRISTLLLRIVSGGSEGPVQRAKALLHTWLGGCYAVLLARSGVEHIHIHHGYFGSWIGMVAARLLGVDFSLTLHGSDLLLYGTYLDVKLQSCAFCLTVSEYNRRYILEHYPAVDADRVIVSRLGVELSERTAGFSSEDAFRGSGLALLAVGRLHAVKDHAFLVRACAELYQRGIEFECSIAGEGPERRHLESLIRKYGLEHRITLLGHVEREQMSSLYGRSDVVVLTSHSEGLPLVLMEAMALGKVVLAPAITGIPELVLAGKTGFLYAAGSLEDFAARLLLIRSLMQAPDHPNADHPRGSLQPCALSAAKPLAWVRHAARTQVRHNFDRRKNLELFGDLFIRRVVAQAGSRLHENSVLQQIQLPIQRDRGSPVRVDGPDAVAGT
jgi:colanic acid/amylovoran biosynthesis glycosyltransferase